MGLREPSCWTYPHFADLAFVDGDVHAKGSHGDEPHIGHSGVAPVFILCDDTEGCQALGIDPRAVSCCQHIAAGALEVEVPAVEGVVVWVAPQPACDFIVGHAHALATLLLARLLWPTRHAMAWVWGQRGQNLEELPSLRPADLRTCPSLCQEPWL